MLLATIEVLGKSYLTNYVEPVQFRNGPSAGGCGNGGGLRGTPHSVGTRKRRCDDGGFC